MAEMIPEILPSTSTAGEKRVFAALSRLPADCLVYYEPVVEGRYPDFIVILPAVGVLIIEVKDWWLAELSNLTPDSITVRRRGIETITKHPRKQARRYMFGLMDKCRCHPQVELLMHEDGPYANRYTFPFCHSAVLSNINRGQIDREAPELTSIFPIGATVTRDQLVEWETLAAEDLIIRLKACFDRWWEFPELTSQQVDVFRSVIHPEVVIRSTSTDLAVLDLRQERNARAVGEGHRIVYGVAGSGKTVLLIARAKLLGEERTKRILVLCYNRPLAAHLAMATAEHSNIEAMTFHSWGVRNGIEFRINEDGATFGERLLHRLQNGTKDFGRYDAVLIDEAQDWPQSWFQCAKLALREPDTGDLLIVGDGSQSLYRKRDFTWADAGIHAAGRAINKKFDLDRNYRNTAEILRAARPFSAKSAGRAAMLLALPVEPDTAIRNGAEPWIVKLEDPASECHYAAALIETWLRGGIDIGGQRQRIKPSDIAILYPDKRADSEVHALSDRLNAFTQVNLFSGQGAKGRLGDEAIRIMTIRLSRGLQFRIVLILRADLLPSRSRISDENIDRGLLYVAMTRAEDMLVILHSGDSAYVKELYKAMGVTPAL